MAGGFSARLVASWPSADLLPVRQIRMVAVPLMTEVPANTTLEAPAGFFSPEAEFADRFLGGIRLAGEQGLVDIEVTALEQTRIRGNEIAGDQLDDIAGNQLADRNRDGLAVTSDCRLHGHRRAQGRHRILRPDILDKIEDDAQHHDDDDDDESGDATRERGHAGRYQEDDHQRVLKTDEELAPKRHGFHVRRVVFAVARKPGLKLRSRQTLDFRLQSGQQTTRRFPPDLLRRRLAGLGGRRRDGRRGNDRGRRDLSLVVGFEVSLVVDFEECHRIRSSRVPASENWKSTGSGRSCSRRRCAKGSFPSSFAVQNCILGR